MADTLSEQTRGSAQRAEDAIPDVFDADSVRNCTVGAIEGAEDAIPDKKRADSVRNCIVGAEGHGDAKGPGVAARSRAQASVRAARRRASREAGLEFIATCPEGFEAALARELRALDLWRVRPLKGRVTFVGCAADAERACLWSRLASRVLVVVARVTAYDANELYDGVRSIAWENVLRRGSTIAVAARGANDELHDPRFTALRVKDALCDRLAERTGKRPDVDVERPDARIAVTLRGDRATLALDLSGEPLFRRMPRAATRTGAPAHVLRPDYAALLLEESGWADACRGWDVDAGRGDADTVSSARAASSSPRADTRADKHADAHADAHADDTIPDIFEADSVRNCTVSANKSTEGTVADIFRADSVRKCTVGELLDLNCAGGGAELEAADMLRRRTPGLSRRRWGFSSWTQHDDAIWKLLVEEARAESRRADELLASTRAAHIIAADPSDAAMIYAQRVLHAEGSAEHVEFTPQQADALTAALDAARVPKTGFAQPAGAEQSSEVDAVGSAGTESTQHAFGPAQATSAANGTAPALALGNATPTSRLHVIADLTELALAQTQPFLTLMAKLRLSGALSGATVSVLTRNDAVAQAMGVAPSRALMVRPNNEDALIYTWELGGTVEQNAPTAAAGGSQVAVPAAAAGSSQVDRVAEGSRAAATTTTSGSSKTATPAKGSAPAAPTAAAVSAKPAVARSANPTRISTASTSIDLGDGTPLALLLPESEQFANRLRKNARLRRRWAKREGVTCYRVYDADLPDYSAAIDLYEGSAATPGRWLVIAEYAAPKTIDPAVAQARFLDILAIAPRVLDVAPENVHARARTRSRGGSQYAGGGKHVGGAGASRGAGTMGPGGHAVNRNAPASPLDRRLPLIEEGGLTFAVDFDNYLDTGIFLDHRLTRELVRTRAREMGARYFLNLFAYTGTATCYAADADVQETVTVDLSNTYLDWAEKNMALNDFTGPGHHYVRDDVMAWIDDMRRTANRWDLIFCDPPTFSNSAKMGRRTWDVQRDHVELLIGVSRLLTRGGEAIFSCNLRTFRPNVEALARAGVELEDITERTIPEDFARNKRIHRCYIVRRM